MSIVSLFQEEGKNKLNHLQLLKIKTDRNNFFTKRGVCFGQALQFYLEKIGHFLKASFSIFKDPLNNFWHNRSILLAIHCSQEAFHRTFSLISTILFFPLVMIAGLFQPNIYRKMQDHLVKSFPLWTTFFSLHQDKIEQFYTRSSFERGEILTILSNLTERQLEEVYSCARYSPEAKVDGALNIVSLSSPEDLKQIEKIVMIYNRSSFAPEEVLKILSNLTEEQWEEVYSCAIYSQEAKVDGVLNILTWSSQEDLKQIEKIVTIYDASSFRAEEVLKILSNLTEEQLEKVYSCIKYSPEAKVDGVLNIVAWSSQEDLRQIEKIVTIYNRSTFKAEEVLKILSRITERQLEEVYSCIKYSPEAKVDGALNILTWSSPEDLRQIEKIVTIYNRSTFKAEEVLKILSRITERQLEEVYSCVRYSPKAKVDGALNILAWSSQEDLKQIEKIVTIYDASSFRAEEVLKILSNLTEEQLEKVYSCIKYSPEAKVDGALNIVAWSSPEDLKQIEKIVKIYKKLSFRAEEVLKILSNLTEELLKDIVFCVDDLSEKKAEDFLTFIKNNREKILKKGQFLKNIRIAATIYDRTFCDLKQVAYTLSHLSVDQAEQIRIHVILGSDFLQALKKVVLANQPIGALLKLI